MSQQSCLIRKYAYRCRCWQWLRDNCCSNGLSINLQAVVGMTILEEKCKTFCCFWASSIVAFEREWIIQISMDHMRKPIFLAHQPIQTDISGVDACEMDEPDCFDHVKRLQNLQLKFPITNRITRFFQCFRELWAVKKRKGRWISPWSVNRKEMFAIHATLVPMVQLSVYSRQLIFNNFHMLHSISLAISYYDVKLRIQKIIL